MSALAAAPSTTSPVSAETLEHVIGTGDLSRLTVRQRVEYYGRVCASVGVNPLTRPFRFLTLDGATVLYATRDLTDQLRASRRISVEIVSRQLDDDILTVTARATAPDGRRDEDIGAVSLAGQRGAARANGMMKANTKAKRRVTLSICGLGFLDESELDGMSGAATWNHDAVAPPVAAVAAPAPEPEPECAPAAKRQTVADWLDNIAAALDAAADAAAVDAVVGRDDVRRLMPLLSPAALERLNDLVRVAVARTAPPAPDSGELAADEPGASVA